MAQVRLRLNSPVKMFYQDKDPKEIYDDVCGDIARSYPYFARQYDSAVRNINFYRTRAWTQTELEAFGRQFRPAYQLNIVETYVDNLLGQHQQTKMDVRAEGVSPEDAPVAQFENKIIKWFEQINDIDKIEQEVFKSGILQGAGCTQVKWDFSDFVSGQPVIEQFPFYQLIWDTHYTQIDFSDCRWMARVIPMRRAEAMEAFPEHAQVIEQFYLTNTITSFQSRLHGIIHDALTPLQYLSQFLYSDENAAREIIYVVEHYERVKQSKWVVVDQLYGDAVEVFDTEADAKNYYDAKVDAYMHGEEPLIDDSGNDRIWIEEITRDCYIQTIVIDDECMSRVETTLPFFPYQVFLPKFADGEFWSPVDSLIQPQRFMNRMVSEWDNQVARGNKQLMTVIQSKLDAGWDINAVNRARSQTGATIPVQFHDAINVIPNNPASSDFPNIISMVQQFALQKSGGANMLGFQENAAESAKAVRARQGAAGLGRLPMFVNLQRWRKAVSEMALWVMREYLTPGQIVRILGADAAEYVEVTDSILDSMREARTNIVIRAAVDGELAREDSFNAIREFLQMNPGVPMEVALPLLMELAPGIDQKYKDSVLQQMQFYQVYMQQQQQQANQDKLQKQVQDSATRKQMKESLQGQLPFAGN